MKLVITFKELRIEYTNKYRQKMIKYRYYRHRLHVIVEFSLRER